MISNKKELSNMLSVLVYCSTDNSFLLVLDKERGDYWIPSSKMDERESWKDNLLSFKKKLFDYEIINEKLLKIIKIWTLQKEYFHLIFQINLPKEFKTNCKTETPLGKVGWYTCAQIMKLKPLLRSLEILEITHNYTPKVCSHTENINGEIIPMGSLTEIRESDVMISSANFDSQIYLNLLDSAGLSASEQYDLYEEFFMSTYPCIYMNQVAFKRAFANFNFPGSLENLFRAADASKRDFLTFQDFLFLIAVMEPYTAHCGHLAEIRCQYIFRYYDDNGDGKLNYHNFQNLMYDILMASSETGNKYSLDKRIESAAKYVPLTALKLTSNANKKVKLEHLHSDPVRPKIQSNSEANPNYDKTNFLCGEMINEFYTHVLETNIRDTTLLLRLVSSHFDLVELSCHDSPHQPMTPNKLVLSTVCHSSEQKKKDVQCEYSIVVKTTILKPGDSPLEIKDLRLLEDTMTKSVTEDFDILSRLKHMSSDSFNLEGKINELLLALKYFCTEICHSPICCGEFEIDEKEAYSWGSAYIEKLGVTLIMMCETLKDILKNEPRLLQIEPAVYIMGDLHGNFHDLMCFEKTLWPNGIALLPAKLLFLGDYVDRGFNSLEVVMYLFANKIQNPEKLFLIRGNHEIREIQKLFTFQRECLYKFGSTLGMSIWKAVNEVFDVLPLAAVIDHKVFCCHGGIPPPWLCPVVGVINSIPCPLVNCERQSPLAWTLMWNDPLKHVFPRNSIQEIELLANEGFIPNVQRGTGFAFSCEALDKFLFSNNLSHVVRAHEVVRAGFQVHQRGKLLTVFSSSGYCGGKNFAGSVLVADKLLRVFMVDTGIN